MALNDSDLTVQVTDEQAAADEADFASTFNATRGEVEPEPPNEDEPEDDHPPEAEAPASEGAPEAPKPVLAGLTEDQIAQALARASQQQSTIDKLGGRLGQLMQQVEALKNAPRTVSDQRAFDGKLTKLSEAFPELAELLREDLKGMAQGDAAPQQAAAPTFTAEDVDRIVSEKLSSFKDQQERGMEVRALGSVHPDWEQVIRTPQFSLWRDNVIEDGKELMESESAQFISRKLTEFKDWVKATTSPVHTPAPAAAPPPAAAAQQRLRAAVLPTTPSTKLSTEPSEEDDFVSAFQHTRKTGGY